MPDIECIGEDSPLLGTQHEPRDDLSKDPQPETQNPVPFVSRVLALLLMSTVGFGAFFCFDNPGALQNEVFRIEHLKQLKSIRTLLSTLVKLNF